MSSPTSVATGPRPADVERWLADLDLEPLERVDREGVVAWDVVLDGRRRHDLPVTLILDPALGLICWAHYAPPIGDGFRKSYRRLLRWNDELPFVKFAIAEDERPILTAEVSLERADADGLGLALARILAASDRLLDDTADWLWLGGRRPAGYDQRPARHAPLLERYAAELGELGELGEPGQPMAQGEPRR